MSCVSVGRLLVPSWRDRLLLPGSTNQELAPLNGVFVPIHIDVPSEGCGSSLLLAVVLAAFLLFTCNSPSDSFCFHDRIYRALVGVGV